MNRREEILKLKESNPKLSGRKIAKILGYSKSLVAYHLSDKIKHKAKMSSIYIKEKNTHSFILKTKSFLRVKPKIYKEYKTATSNYTKIDKKIRDFHKNRQTGEQEIMSFTYKDVIDRFGENPKCYLTGKEIDLSKPKSYNFDHIMPASKGGPNTLDNLGICTKAANMAKSDLTYEELIDLCKSILDTHNKKSE